ncbi:MAG: hypothetical protein P8X62_11305 [Flavobacteriaceae bacterium]
MFIIKVKEELIQHCTQQISKYNFGKRSQANGTPEQQLTGIIGQSVIMELFGIGIYIFCSYHKNKKELTICGWITKEDFIQKRRFYKKGSTRTRSDNSTFQTFSDLYEIDNTDLNQVNSLNELKNELVQL